MQYISLKVVGAEELEVSTVAHLKKDKDKDKTNKSQDPN